MRPIFLAGLCWLLGFTTTASAHDWYTGLTSPTGERCCNGLDCEAVDQRYNGQSRQLELGIGGNWYPIEFEQAPLGALHRRPGPCLLRAPLARAPDDARVPVHHPARRGVSGSQRLPLIKPGAPPAGGPPWLSPGCQPSVA